MKKVGYDIDNVLKPTIDLGLDLINEKYGKSYTMEDLKYPTFEESFGLPTEDINVLFRKASREGLLTKLSPIDGSKEVVNFYHGLLEQYFVTARINRMRETTLEWFDNNSFLYLPERVIFDGNTPKKKADIAIDLKLELFIEDNLHNANAIAEEAEIPVLLVDFDYRFNQNQPYYHELIKIVKSWKEIDGELKKLL